MVSFVLIENGLHWHVRAFDRKWQEFRDSLLLVSGSLSCLNGNRWRPMRRAIKTSCGLEPVELGLVPHPDQPRPQITEMDYGLRVKWSRFLKGQNRYLGIGIENTD